MLSRCCGAAGVLMLLLWAHAGVAQGATAKEYNQKRVDDFTKKIDAVKSAIKQIAPRLAAAKKDRAAASADLTEKRQAHMESQKAMTQVVALRRSQAELDPTVYNTTRRVEETMQAERSARQLAVSALEMSDEYADAVLEAEQARESLMRLQGSPAVNAEFIKAATLQIVYKDSLVDALRAQALARSPEYQDELVKLREARRELSVAIYAFNRKTAEDPALKEAAANMTAARKAYVAADGVFNLAHARLTDLATADAALRRQQAKLEKELARLKTIAKSSGKGGGNSGGNKKK